MSTLRMASTVVTVASQHNNKDDNNSKTSNSNSNINNQLSSSPSSSSSSFHVPSAIVLFTTYFSRLQYVASHSQFHNELCSLQRCIESNPEVAAICCSINWKIIFHRYLAVLPTCIEDEE